jgi:hypothetical protein
VLATRKEGDGRSAKELEAERPKGFWRKLFEGGMIIDWWRQGPSMAESQLAELQNIRVLLEEARQPAPSIIIS